MDSAMDQSSGDSGPHSVDEAWRQCKRIPSATSVSEAWSSFRKMFDALPVWAVVVGGVSLFMLLTHAWVVPVLAAVGCTLAAVFYTVKHAVRQALREHDSD